MRVAAENANNGKITSF